MPQTNNGDDRSTKLLVVWATTRCQLRCKYCYMRAGEVPELDLAEATFTLAAENLGLGPGSEIQIAGGEPLLAPHVVEFVARHAKRLGVSRISLQTNGIAIDDAFIALVKKYRIGVGVSLDAPPEINDRVRGRGAEVIRGLSRLEAEAIPFGVTAVVSRDTVSSLPDLGLLLAGFSQARSLGLDILRPAGRATAADLPSPKMVHDAFITLTKYLAWANQNRRTPLKLRELAENDCGNSAGYCPSEFGLGAALTADGALYPCASLVERPEYYCGTAEAPDYPRLRSGLQPDHSSCGNCAVQGCKGRCPSLALLSPKAGKLDCVMRLAVARPQHRIIPIHPPLEGAR